MGACECENPIEFGYELNASEKDKDTDNNDKEKKEYFSKLNYKKNNYKYIANQNLNLNYQKFKENNEIINIDKNENEMDNRNNYDIYDIVEPKKISEENKEGVNALKFHIESKNEKINNTENTNSNFYFTTTSERPKDEFSEYIFDNINQIRENPQSFIKVIEQAKKNIILDKRGIYIYKSIVKVALSRGLPAFDETIDFLKKLNPMPKLIFSNDLLIDAPINEEQLKDKKYMNEQINAKVQNGIPIKSFWRDIIKDPETCLILMIVDDNGPNSGKKRNDILDPNMQCIGIVSKKIGKNFASYITLC
jgi:hypothetical protein